MAARITNNKPLVWTRETVYSRCDEMGECQIWREGVTASGSPRARVNGSGTTNIRNFMFTEVMGRKILPGCTIQPKCGNPRCVSEECLVQISMSTMRKNIAKRLKATPYGMLAFQKAAQRAGFSTLGPAKASEIRRSDRPARELAEAYGVDLRTIHRVRKHEIWAPVASSIFNLGG